MLEITYTHGQQATPLQDPPPSPTDLRRWLDCSRGESMTQQPYRHAARGGHGIGLTGHS